MYEEMSLTGSKDKDIKIEDTKKKKKEAFDIIQS